VVANISVADERVVKLKSAPIKNKSGKDNRILFMICSTAADLAADEHR
jgi:hypothetical protein